MAMYVEVVVRCDHPGCEAETQVLLAEWVGGFKVPEPRVPGWKWPENGVQQTRRHFLCPRHAREESLRATPKVTSPDLEPKQP